MENLEFLSDVVPRTVSYKQHKQKQAKEANQPTNGQSTLDVHVGSKEGQATNGAMAETMDAEMKDRAAGSAPHQDHTEDMDET